MTTARKPRPKSSKLFLIAFKKSRITRLIKLLLPLLCLVLKQGDSTHIYIVKAKSEEENQKEDYETDDCIRENHSLFKCFLRADLHHKRTFFKMI
ncbi:hypothetical protein DQQ10_05250 [Pseudochryseolinea flava]|uniref:Uncharacterized protein n=1 Tax=Pseudochryseolinea flava TaxID=2059302 RepID=A0A364Y4P8_9BACT|nr:hypothetical protein DQQ10_05250 [Pseudochryseolinea flava]